MEIIKLNLIPSGVNPTCHCSQYDDGRVIRIELFDGLTPYTLQSGDTVTLNVRKPDNHIVTTTLTATQGNKYVDLVTTEQICACVGYNLCDLTITNGSKVIGTLNFIMQVERDVLADGIPSQSVIEDLDELVQEAVGDNYYTKDEVDDALALKADKSTTYTKTEVDNKLADYYTKTEIDTALALKADKSELYNLLPTDTASGSIANFADGADNIPVKSLVAQIVAQQAGSGDPSPSNVRSISGFSSVTAYQTGKNLCPSLAEEVSSNQVTFKPQTDGSILIDGTATGGNAVLDLNRDVDFILPSGTYFINENASVYSIVVYKVVGGVASIVKNGGGSFVLTENTKVFIRIFVTSGTIANNVRLPLQIEVGNTATTYEQYTGNTFTIDLGETVYGGEVDVVSGSGMSDYIEVDLGDLDWLYDSVYSRFYTTTDLPIFHVENTEVPFMNCTEYNTVTFNSFIADNVNYTISNPKANGKINIRNTNFTDATLLKAELSGVKLYYKTTTPTPIATTPEQFNTLYGDNNFYADCGSVDLTYRADIKLYVDKRVSQIPAALSLSRVAAPSGEAESEER